MGASRFHKSMRVRTREMVANDLKGADSASTPWMAAKSKLRYWLGGMMAGPASGDNTATLSTHVSSTVDTVIIKTLSEMVALYFFCKSASGRCFVGANIHTSLNCISAGATGAALIGLSCFVGILGLCRDAFEGSMCRAGINAQVLVIMYFTMLSFCWIEPTYLAMGLLNTSLCNVHLLLMVACAGRCGRLYLVTFNALISIVGVVLPTLYAPEVEADMMTIGDCLRARYGIYMQRSVWPRGSSGTALWLWHAIGGLAWIITILMGHLVTIQDLKKRVSQQMTLLKILTIMQVCHTIIGSVAVGRMVYTYANTNADRLFLDYVCYFQISVIIPLVMLIAGDATGAHEHETQMQLAAAQRARQHAEEVARFRSSFLRYISHELRTPLLSISLGIEDIAETLQLPYVPPAGWATSVSGGGHSSSSNASAMALRRLLKSDSLTVDKECIEQLQQTLSILATAATAAQHTIDSTLDVEKIDSGQMTVELRPTSLERCLAKVFHLMQPIANARKISMSMARSVSVAKAEANLEGIFVLLDEDKIEQVLRNLVSNGE